MKWERPENVFNKKGSYRFRCSGCKHESYYVTSNNGKRYKEADPKCKYIYCPWCGEMNEDAINEKN